jgi:hypothetical protein
MSESLTEPDNIRKHLDDKSLDLFWWFINERQQIWYRRVVEGQQSPWTDDDILQEYRFTNVYRELDPGTQYVIQNILEVDAPQKDKIFNVMLYRLIGRLETHEYLGFQSLNEFDADEFEKRLKHRRDNLGETVFTGAYMVSGYNHMGSSDKIENVAAIFDEITGDSTFFENVLTAGSLEDAYDLIRSQSGFGNFLSYQVIVDLLYPVDVYDGDSLLPFKPDEWSTPGPGAQKGLKQLVTEFQGFDQLNVMRWLNQYQQQEFDRLGLQFNFLETRKDAQLTLSLADIQNCLCEFYKYHKILNSKGRARRCFRDSEARSAAELRSIYEAAPRVQI